MASTSRDDRQQMRQRGAGTRAVNNVDFGLSFDTMRQNSREERQLMRQRGAGTRKINDIDFGIAFPTPTGNRRSASKTPRPGSQVSRRPSKTPSRTSRAPSATRSVRGSSASTRRTTKKRQDVYEIPEQKGGEGTTSSVKRRKLNNDAASGSPLTLSTNVQAISVDVDRRASTSRRKTASKPVMIAEEPQEGPVQSIETVAEVQEHHASEGLLSLDVDKENVLPGAEKQSKRKKRKSIGQQSGRRKKRSSGNSIVRAVSTAETEGDMAGTSRGNGAAIDTPAEATPEATASAELSARPPAATESGLPLKKRKKRKSVILVKKKRRSSGTTSQGTSEPQQLMTPDGSTESLPVNAIELEDAEDAEAPEDEVRSARRTLKSIPRRRRPSPRSEAYGTSPAPVPLENEDNEDDDYVEDESPEPPTPAITKKTRKRRNYEGVTSSADKGSGNASRKSRSKHSAPPKPKKTKSTFPILTHRLTNSAALPTIVEEIEEPVDSDDDLNSASVRFPERTVPNAIDVLAQICRETIEASVNKVPGSTGRAENKRKRAALEAFGAELESRLFDMSAAVENRLTLEARVKRSKREKSDLQARWIEVRRQREEIALKCDAVRRKHWQSEKEGSERYALSEQIHSLEMAMEREQDEAEDGLEFMLRSVGAKVSAAEGGGLLERVRDFNRQLEKTAAVLEGRVR